jgi:hypothetical protein
MSRDPLNPGEVRPIDIEDIDHKTIGQDPDEEERTPTDTRPWWMRLVTSLRPSVSQEKIVRTGKTADEFEIKGHIDF